MGTVIDLGSRIPAMVSLKAKGPQQTREGRWWVKFYRRWLNSPFKVDSEYGFYHVIYSWDVLFTACGEGAAYLAYDYAMQRTLAWRADEVFEYKCPEDYEDSIVLDRGA